MRVTQSATSRLYMRNLNSNLGQMNKLSNRVTTGRKFEYGSEDPSGSAQAMRIRKSIFANDYYVGNLNAAEDILSAAEGSLMTITNLGKEAYERVIQGMNGTLAGDDKAIIAENLENITDEILKTINTTFTERYMFSGSGNTEKPFYMSGDRLTFNGVDVNDAVAMSEFPEAKKVFFDVGLGLRFLPGSVGSKEITSTKLDPSSLIDTAYAKGESSVSFNVDFKNTNVTPPVNIQIPVTVSGIDALNYSFTPPREPLTDQDAITNYRNNFQKALDTASEAAIDAAIADTATNPNWPTNANGTKLRPKLESVISDTGAMSMTVAIRPGQDGITIPGIDGVVDTTYLTAEISDLTQTVSTTLNNGTTISSVYAPDGTVTTTGTIPSPPFPAGTTDLAKMLQVGGNGRPSIDATTGMPTMMTLANTRFVDALVDAAGDPIPNPSAKQLTLNLKLNNVQKTVTASVESFDYTTTPPTLLNPSVPATEKEQLDNLVKNLQHELDIAYPPTANGTKGLQVKLGDDGKITMTAPEGEFMVLDYSANDKKHLQSFDYKTLFELNTTFPATLADMPYGHRMPADPLPTINVFIDGKEYTFQVDPSYDFFPKDAAGNPIDPLNPVQTIMKPADEAAYSEMPQSKNAMMKQAAANLELQIRTTLYMEKNPGATPPLDLSATQGVAVSTTPFAALVFDVPPTSEVKNVGTKSSSELGIWTNKSQGAVIDPQSALEVSLPGVEMLGFGRNEKGEPNNLISLISTLAAEFKKEDFNVPKVASLLTNLEKRNNTVIIGLTEIGSRTAFIDFNRTRLETENFNLKAAQTRVEIADPAGTIMEYKGMEMAYMATLQMGAKVIPSSLFDFMR